MHKESETPRTPHRSGVFCCLWVLTGSHGHVPEGNGIRDTSVWPIQRIHKMARDARPLSNKTIQDAIRGTGKGVTPRASCPIVSRRHDRSCESACSQQPGQAPPPVHLGNRPGRAENAATHARRRRRVPPGSRRSPVASRSLGRSASRRPRSVTARPTRSPPTRPATRRQALLPTAIQTVWLLPPPVLDRPGRR